MSSSKPNPAPRAWILCPADAPAPRVWGLTPAERIRRSLLAAGIVGQTGPAVLADDGRSEAHTLLFDARWIYDERLVAALAETPGTLLVTSPDAGGVPVAAHVPAARARSAADALLAGDAASPALAGLDRRTPDSLAGAYTAHLRRAATPVLLRADPASVDAIERRLFGDSYKGITDLVTKYVWPAPARFVVKRLAERGVRPNTVTALSYALVVAASLLFWSGWFGSGLACAWLMTFLDTVDGKLARVTLTATRLGNVLDHGLDLVHPPFWWAAFAAGLPSDAAWVLVSGWIAVGGYVVGRLVEGVFLLLFKIEIHSWTRLDSRFREITARRNPNLLLLTVGTLAGRPDLGLAAVALWTVASIAFHVARTARAWSERRRGGEIAAWNAAPPASPASRAPALAAALLLAALPVAPLPARASEAPPAVAAPSAAGSGSTIGPAETPGDSLVSQRPARRGNGVSRLPSGEFATELWDFTARFESGHLLLLQFLNTNIGYGDGNTAVTGQLVTPDGEVIRFRTGDSAGDWKLSPDGRRLELEKALLDQGDGELRIRFEKKKVKLDLRVQTTGPAAWSSDLSRAGYAVDLLESAAPIEGTIWTEGMAAPLAVRGVVGETHRWFDDLEARLVQRRIELFSLDGNDAIYLIDARTPKGASHAWLVVQRGGKTLREVEVDVKVAETAARDGYGVPDALEISGAGVSGTIRFGRELARYAPLGDLPAPIRVVVSVATKPLRIWRAASFELELRDPGAVAPTALHGDGIGEVTFLNPLPAKDAPTSAFPTLDPEEMRCASAY